MTRQLFVACLITAFAMFLSDRAHAETIAHWDFETDLIAGSATSGQVVSHRSETGVFNPAIEDLSGNGNHLSAFTPNVGTPSFADMYFSDIVAPNNQTRSTLSVEAMASGTCCPILFNDGTGNDGDLNIGGVDVGALPQWTIEASVNFKSTSGFQTIVGKDGIGQIIGVYPTAPLYLQKRGDSFGEFRILFADNAGFAYATVSETIPVPGKWYHLAAVSDGSMLSLYVNGALEGQEDLTQFGSPDTAMAAIDETGFEGSGTAVPYTWSIARGMFDDEHADRVNGYIDDVRISNVALDPADFLNNVSPEPPVNGLRINGNSVAQSGGGMRLVPALTYQRGSAFTAQRVAVETFHATFTFQMTGAGGVTDASGQTGADGLTFTIQNVSPAALGSDGGSIGYGGLNPSVAVEWDTYLNSFDRDSNHLGIDTYGSLTSLRTLAVGDRFDNGAVWHAWVDYDGATLQVRTNMSGDRPLLPDLTLDIDIPGVLGSNSGFVGFTSSTGAAFENVDILSWRYAIAEPATAVLLVLGCLGLLARNRSRSSTAASRVSKNRY